ncbi:hypothetical protein BH09VER1_BH09VER1_27680 [soil metagenome]
MSRTELRSTICKWTDGKEAVFLLEFDDSAPSHLRRAIPEIIKRGLVGTFYINPGNPPYQSLLEEWRNPGPGIEYANHTHTHIGATSQAQLQEELAPCEAEINRCYPQRKQRRLVSFGRPGGVPWTITPAETKEVLGRFHLVARPPFQGYPFNIKSRAEMLGLIDTALATGEMEHHDFHGVEEDWHTTPMEWYVALLDKLVALRDRIWVTDPISWHQYVIERESARVTTDWAGADVSVALDCTAEAELYDLPLSIETTVPATWEACEIRQGSRKTLARVQNGIVKYSAVPNAEAILIQAARR